MADRNMTILFIAFACLACWASSVAAFGGLNFGFPKHSPSAPTTKDGSQVPVIKCDDISDLCNIKSNVGTLTIRGQTLKYYIYESASTPSSLPALIGVHGGPGGNHHELETLKKQACDGRKVILYDQVGGGESSRPDKNAAPWLYTIDYYIEELRAVIDQLKIQSFYILGHSWGGIIVQEYAIKYSQQDNRLKGIILASIFSDAEVYQRGQWQENLSTLPDMMQQVLKEADRTKNFKSPTYQYLTEALTYYYTTRTLLPVDCLNKALSNLNQDIYEQMQGASEFTVGGVLESYNSTGQLSSINIPALVTRGKYDTMTRLAVKLMADQIPTSEYMEFEHSGHMTMIDDVTMYNKALQRFMSKHDHSSMEAMEQQEQSSPQQLLLGPPMHYVQDRSSSSSFFHKRSTNLRS